MKLLGRVKQWIKGNAFNISGVILIISIILPFMFVLIGVSVRTNALNDERSSSLLNVLEKNVFIIVAWVIIMPLSIYVSKRTKVRKKVDSKYVFKTKPVRFYGENRRLKGALELVFIGLIISGLLLYMRLLTQLYSSDPDHLLVSTNISFVAEVILWLVYAIVLVLYVRGSSLKSVKWSLSTGYQGRAFLKLLYLYVGMDMSYGILGYVYQSESLSAKRCLAILILSQVFCIGLLILTCMNIVMKDRKYIDVIAKIQRRESENISPFIERDENFSKYAIYFPMASRELENVELMDDYISKARIFKVSLPVLNGQTQVESNTHFYKFNSDQAHNNDSILIAVPNVSIMHKQRLFYEFVYVMGDKYYLFECSILFLRENNELIPGSTAFSLAKILSEKQYVKHRRKKYGERDIYCGTLDQRFKQMIPLGVRIDPRSVNGEAHGIDLTKSDQNDQRYAVLIDQGFGTGKTTTAFLKLHETDKSVARISPFESGPIKDYSFKIYQAVMRTNLKNGKFIDKRIRSGYKALRNNPSLGIYYVIVLSGLFFSFNQVCGILGVEQNLNTTHYHWLLFLGFVIILIFSLYNLPYVAKLIKKEGEIFENYFNDLSSRFMSDNDIVLLVEDIDRERDDEDIYQMFSAIAGLTSSMQWLDFPACGVVITGDKEVLHEIFSAADGRKSTDDCTWENIRSKLIYKEDSFSDVVDGYKLFLENYIEYNLKDTDKCSRFRDHFSESVPSDEENGENLNTNYNLRDLNSYYRELFNLEGNDR